jgi:hypothetical protein
MCINEGTEEKVKYKNVSQLLRRASVERLHDGEKGQKRMEST